jgi:hypothetical protein
MFIVSFQTFPTKYVKIKLKKIEEASIWQDCVHFEF